VKRNEKESAKDTHGVFERIKLDVRWQADRVVGKGPGHILLALGGGLACIALTGAVVRWGIARGKTSFGHSLWDGVSRTLDVSSLQQDKSWPIRFVGLLLILLGVFGSALVTAVVVTTFQGVVQRVRDGRTDVRVVPRVVVLGWSEQIGTLLKELHAGAGGELLHVAVLSERQRSWMDSRLRDECAQELRRNLRIHCRSGDRTHPRDLRMVQFHQAKTVVVFSESDDSVDADIVKTVFSCMRAGFDFQKQALITEVTSHDTSRALRMVTANRLLTINSTEILSLVLAQGVRDRGMGQVFQQLTSYDGSEIYFRAVDAVSRGRQFGDVVLNCENSVPIGIRTGELVEILPALSRVLRDGEDLIFIAQNDHDLLFGPMKAIEMPARPPEPIWTKQKVLVIGWNRIFARSASHVQNFLAEGSELIVCVDASVLGPEEERTLRHSTSVNRTFLESTTSATLEKIREELGSGTYDAVTLIPYREKLSATHADAETLIALSAVRLCLKELGLDTRVLAELRETRAAELAELVTPDDLILSDSLTASLVSQLSDRPFLDSVLADLLDFRGAAFFIHPVDRWNSFRRPGLIRFGEISENCLLTGEIAVGLRIGASVHLNPSRTEPFEISSISGIIVLSAGLEWDERTHSQRIADLGD
jgi:ion channel POLLUX/CASTOR